MKLCSNDNQYTTTPLGLWYKLDNLANNLGINNSLRWDQIQDECISNVATGKLHMWEDRMFFKVDAFTKNNYSLNAL